MTADHRGESGQQRTVAELLKQYGGEDPSGNGRRRRRSGGPDGDPPAAPPTQRSDGTPPRDADPVTGSGGYPAVGAEPTGGHRPVAPAADGTGAYGAVGPANGTGTYRTGDGGGFEAFDLVRPGSGADDGYGRAEPRSGFDAASGTGWSGAPDQGPPTLSGGGGFSAPSYRADIYQAGAPAPGAPSAAGTPPRREDSTDFIPRYGEVPAAPAARSAQDSGPSTAVTSRTEMFDDEDHTGPNTTVGSPAEMFDDEDERVGPGSSAGSRAAMFDDEDDDRDANPRDRSDDEPGGFLGGRLRRGKGATPPAVPEAAPADSVDLFTSGSAASSSGPVTADVPAGLALEDDAAEVERQGGPKVWLVLVGQLLLGAIVGAGLWIGFRYLWLNVPVAALAAAVLATAGLVLLVRAIRRSDDLQTTMLAVLVGLVVTISPAVLLLADR